MNVDCCINVNFLFIKSSLNLKKTKNNNSDDDSDCYGDDNDDTKEGKWKGRNKIRSQYTQMILFYISFNSYTEKLS